jgi:hypothetical protein
MRNKGSKDKQKRKTRVSNKYKLISEKEYNESDKKNTIIKTNNKIKYYKLK